MAPAGPDAFQLAAIGEETGASMRVPPKEKTPWGRFHLTSTKVNPNDPPLVSIDIVDVNQEIGRERFGCAHP